MLTAADQAVFFAKAVGRVHYTLSVACRYLVDLPRARPYLFVIAASRCPRTREERHQTVFHRAINVP